MNEYISVSQDIEAIAVNANIQVSVRYEQLYFEYAGVSLEPVPDRTPLVRFENQLELTATVLGDGFQQPNLFSGRPEQLEELGGREFELQQSATSRPLPPHRFYNYLVLEQSSGFVLFGFTSCFRFAGYFELHQGELGTDVLALIDGEDSPPQYWDSNVLESLAVIQGEQLSEVFARYVELINHHHPRRSVDGFTDMLGWSSKCVDEVPISHQALCDNLVKLKAQQAMLSWVALEHYPLTLSNLTQPELAQRISQDIEQVKQCGKQLALRLMPLAVGTDDPLIEEHPDWFIHDARGCAITLVHHSSQFNESNQFQLLDGSQLEVQAFITQRCQLLCQRWGVQLLMLDFNLWGAIKGYRHQFGVTGVSAYRLSMQAIQEGVGDKVHLMAINAPAWPSLGLVDIMRFYDSDERTFAHFETTARQAFFRYWQHQTLWLMDPDSARFMSLPNQGAPRWAYEFHRNALLTSGGILLSGDPLSDMTPFCAESLQQLIVRHRSNHNSATFASLAVNHAVLPLSENNRLHCLFHYQDQVSEYTLTSEYPCDWFDFWTGEKYNLEPTQIQIVAVNSQQDSRAIVAVTHLDE
ncbi:glycosyl hydrolase [Vibrio hippocampi]|uniref:Uncharacterized protein n=1 Tax=Vibrio hippocampi TaxID=654686 RepID=A0ABN8DG37_9VIBR|nr:glycosyl hydrolase [Vibrio hippocampi]CAH0526379.1 hypothetical protein VHP8226_01776 [Vibrio hippocampi]